MHAAELSNVPSVKQAHLAFAELYSARVASIAGEVELQDVQAVSQSSDSETPQSA